MSIVKMSIVKMSIIKMSIVKMSIVNDGQTHKNVNRDDWVCALIQCFHSCIHTKWVWD